MRKNFTPMLILKIVLLFATATLFSSCKDLLDASSLKDEIEKKVEYINSQDVEITFESTCGIIKPDTKKHYKKTDSDLILFTPFPSYQFVEWQVFLDDDTEPLSDEAMAELIEFGDINNTDTAFTLKGVVPSLRIKPLCVERPVILSSLPAYKPSGVYRDSRIQVFFDHAMSPESIYYTADELKNIKFYSLLADADRDGSVPTSIDEITVENKIYAYTTSEYDKPHYKNITLTGMEKKFKAPYFEAPDTLIIPTVPYNSDPFYFGDQPPAPGTKIVVTLSNFFYKDENTLENIYMAEDKKWLYLVNTNVDNIAPIITNIQVKNSRAESLDSRNDTVLPDKKIYVDAAIMESGSGPENTFTIKIQKLLNGFGEMLLPFEKNANTLNSSYNYTSLTTTEAKFNGVIDLTKYSDGVYIVSFSFFDKTSNTVTTQSYRFKIGTIDRFKPFFGIDAINNSFIASWPADELSVKTAEWKYEVEVTNKRPRTVTTPATIERLPNGYYCAKLSYKTPTYDEAMPFILNLTLNDGSPLEYEYTYTFQTPYKIKKITSDKTETIITWERDNKLATGFLLFGNSTNSFETSHYVKSGPVANNALGMLIPALEDFIAVQEVNAYWWIVTYSGEEPTDDDIFNYRASNISFDGTSYRSGYKTN